MSARYAYVALAGLSVALAAAAILFAAWDVQSNDRKFCGVVSVFTGTPVPRPADPSANPSRVTDYELYMKFRDLGAGLGC